MMSDNPNVQDGVSSPPVSISEIRNHASPARLSYESLLNRPRSNPRNRTPMRYESPLDPTAFHRNTVVAEDENQVEQQPVEERRIRPIRIAPLFGAAASSRSSQQTKSSKQGPSKRKVQRWNNDSFRGLAAELESANSSAAQVLIQAQADAHLYRSIYSPKRPREVPFEKLPPQVQEEFRRGEIGLATSTTSTSRNNMKHRLTTAELLMKRVHGRLINIVSRLQSSPSIKTLEQMEAYLVEGTEDCPVQWDLEQVLKRPPSSTSQDGVVFDFYPSAGLQRLFLHAVCQFHDLQISTKSLEHSKQLIVSGNVQGAQYKLLQHLPKSSQLSGLQAEMSSLKLQ